jgi:hypothetical protein
MRVVRVVVAGLAALAAFVAHGQPSHACTCGERLIQTVPADGATGVPRNAVPVVRLDDPQPTDRLFVRERDTGVEVPVVVEERQYHEFMVLANLRPVALLSASTAYELVLESPTWFEPAPRTIATFITADQVDSEPPPFEGLAGFVGETTEISGCYNSCAQTYGWSFLRLRLDYGQPADAAYYVLEVRHRTDLYPATWRVLIPHPWYDMHVLESETCAPAQPPPMIAGEPYCMRLAAYDLAGNSLGGDVERCAGAVACELQLDDNCWPLPECIVIEEPEEELIPPPEDDGACRSNSGRAGWLLVLVILIAIAWRPRAPIN